MEPDENEVNDTWEAATVLSVYQDLTLNGDNDVDWFKVTVGANQDLKINFTNVPSGLGYRYELYQESELQVGNNNYLDYQNALSDREINYTVAEAGNYFIKISVFGRISGSLANVKFKITYGDPPPSQLDFSSATYTVPENSGVVILTVLLTRTIA